MDRPVSSRPPSPASSQEITPAYQPSASGALAGRTVTQTTSTRSMLIASERLRENQPATSLSDRKVGTAFTRDSSLTNRSVSNPVTGPLSRVEGKRLAQQMLENISHLKSSGQGYNDLVYPEGLRGPVMIGRGATNHAVRILSKIEGMRTFDDSKLYAYKVNNKPVGLMSGLERPGTFHIEYIASDPYARGAGTALIEKAVNISVEKGKNGKVSLIPDSSGAKQQYSKLGFIEEDPYGLGAMVLNPKNSEKWVMDKGDYVYADERGKKYLTGI